jgi:hypothetical protein
MVRPRKRDPDIIDYDYDYDEADPRNQYDSDETQPQYDADDRKVDSDERRERGIKKE